MRPVRSTWSRGAMPDGEQLRASEGVRVAAKRGEVGVINRSIRTEQRRAEWGHERCTSQAPAADDGVCEPPVTKAHSGSVLRISNTSASVRSALSPRSDKRPRFIVDDVAGVVDGDSHRRGNDGVVRVKEISKKRVCAETRRREVKGIDARETGTAGPNHTSTTQISHNERITIHVKVHRPGGHV